MSKYRISISFDEKNFFWIVVDNGTFIRHPIKEDLIDTKLKYYNKTNICNKCRECNDITDKSILYPLKAYKEKDKNGNETGRWVCTRCWSKNYQKFNSNSQVNIKKSLANCRTGNGDPNSDNIKGKRSQKLACRLYGWKDLNEENNDYTTPIDCYDPKTGLYHQVQGRYYNSVYQLWAFSSFERELGKKYKSMICFCISNDGKIIERIYIFPWREIMIVKGISVYKNPTDSHGNIKISFYDKYGVIDEGELKNANKIWTQILKEEAYRI